MLGALADDLCPMKEWLYEQGCQVVAMESAGVYWRSVHSVLEDAFRAILVNARSVKHLSGRKTDVSDSRWLAGLLRLGLFKGSFIPKGHVRQWRDLSRLRKACAKSLSDYKRRVHKLFERANIKIESVVSDLFGATGWSLIAMLASGEEITIDDISRCIRGKLKGKEEELLKSIKGFFSEHHRFQLVSMHTLIEALGK